MHILRKVGLGILSPLFIFLLFATAFDVGLIRTAAHPATVKKIVAESGIYDSVVPSLLRQAKTISTPLGDISTSDPTIRDAANRAVSPVVIRQQTEAAVDSLYQWLDGRVSQPNFTIGVAGDTAGLADSISGAVGQRLSQLPACSAAQSLAITRAGNFDAVNATCLPRGVTAAGITSQLKSAIAADQDFVSQASVSPASIKNGSGQSVFQQSSVKNIPVQYQRAKKTPVILIILTILIGAAIIFLSNSRPKGLRHIGVSLLIVGLIMLLFSWALNRAMSTKIAPAIKLDNAILQQDVRSLITDLSQRIDKNYWLFGGVYTVLGAAAIASGQWAVRRDTAGRPLDKVNIELVPHPKKK